MNKIGDRGDPYTSLVFTSGFIGVRKSLNLILAWRSLIKLTIYFLMIVRILRAYRQEFKLVLFTLLKAPLRLNTIRVTTLCLYHTQSIALERTNRAYLVVLPRRPLN